MQIWHDETAHDLAVNSDSCWEFSFLSQQINASVCS